MPLQYLPPRHRSTRAFSGLRALSTFLSLFIDANIRLLTR
jgi:hypothetical protein